MKIREMTIDDYNRVVELWLRSGLEVRVSGRESRENIAMQLGALGDFMLVAEEGVELIGVVIGSHDHRKGWVNRLAVLPERQGCGVARALVAALESEFEKSGIRIFCGLVRADNAASIALCEKMGYSSMPEIRYFSKRPDGEA
jgi:N-acetylglutamate synthase